MRQALPSSDDELRARLASNTPRTPIGKHVLIAGTSVLNNRLFKQLVELQGATTTLTSIPEVLQAAIKEQPNLIIVDVMGVPEFELGKTLKGNGRTQKLPLVGISSHDKHLVVAHHYDCFVAKPIGILNFLKLLDSLLLR